MAELSRDALKQFFRTGCYPQQQDFYNWLESFVHKDDGIALGQVEGLMDALNGKADKSIGEALEAALQASLEAAEAAKGAESSVRTAAAAAETAKASAEEMKQATEALVATEVATLKSTMALLYGQLQRSCTLNFCAGEDTYTDIYMDGSGVITKVSGYNVSKVRISIVNGASAEYDLSSGSAECNLNVRDGSIVVYDIQRKASGSAAIGVKYALDPIVVETE